MKNIAKILAVVACAAAVAMPAAAQEKKSSISAFGNYSKYENSPASGNANVGYGYLVSPHLELGLNFMKTFGASSLYGIGGTAQYYFSTVGRPGAVNPYVKGNVFAMTGQGFDATTYGGYVGAAYAITESSEVFAEAGAVKQSANSTSTSGTEVNFGIKVRF